MTPARLDLGAARLDRGGHLLVKRALADVSPGQRLAVTGSDPELVTHLRAWARAWAADFEPADNSLGAPRRDRWSGAERAGTASHPDANPPATWGLAARGAAVEAGTPRFDFRVGQEAWSDDAGRLYAAAAAAQWDPATAVDWQAAFELPEEVEDAVVQLMPFLVENETAALLVPARFVSQIHPHFREVMQLLAINAADEARHVEVFTRRALLRRPEMALSTAGGQASLKTLLDEPNFALASFMLSVLGEGSFLSLLRFIDHFGPDPVTRQVCRLAAQDEARHVAFGLAHLEEHARRDPSLLDRLARAVEHRHGALVHTAGLNEEVFDALVLLAAGRWDNLEAGWEAVVALRLEMDNGRQARLRRLGFTEPDAARLSSLHTRNFM